MLERFSNAYLPLSISLLLINILSSPLLESLSTINLHSVLYDDVYVQSKTCNSPKDSNGGFQLCSYAFMGEHVWVHAF